MIFLSAEKVPRVVCVDNMLNLKDNNHKVVPRYLVAYMDHFKKILLC